MTELRRFCKQNRDGFLVLFCGAVYLLWFFFLEQHVTNNYHIIHVALDDYIPFCEYFIVPYLLWFVYVIGFWCFFYRRERAIFRKMSVFLFTGMFAALLLCTIYPNGTDFRPAVNPDKNVFSALVFWLYGADTPTNVLPSIHVFNSIGIHTAIMQSEYFRNKRGVRSLSFALCVLICMATVFLKQHSIVDVIAASVMAYAVYGAVYLPDAETVPARTAKHRIFLGNSEN